MTAKRIFILDGHPAEKSLSATLARTYAAAAQAAGHDVRMAHLHALEFDSDYGYAGYSHHKPLEPALEQVLEDVRWCDHMVLITPMWWGGLPAKLKGLFDRTFLPGIAFDTRSAGLPKPLLAGRSARVIITSDTPRWYFALAYHNALVWQLRRQILGFVGFKPARFTLFSGASHPAATAVQGWIARIGRIGSRAV